MTPFLMTHPRDGSVAAGGFTLAAVAGAMGGAVGGTVLGAALETAYPMSWGTLGTMIGSGLAASAWCLLVQLWSGLSARREATGAGVRVARVTGPSSAA